jgi:hypothetical protein
MITPAEETVQREGTIIIVKLKEAKEKDYKQYKTGVTMISKMIQEAGIMIVAEIHVI